LTKPKILHPWPQDRFAVKNPRRKPGACRTPGFRAGAWGNLTAKDEESPSLLRSDEAHMEADLWPGSHNQLIIRSNARAQRMTGLVIERLPDAALG
jgi:hypothetical protein